MTLKTKYSVHPHSSAQFPYLDEQHLSFFLCRQARIFRQETVVAEDGRPLSVFEAGERGRSTVVLINPLGVSCLFLVNLACHLAQYYHVVTWESRGLPHYYGSVDSEDDWHPERHCRDLGSILIAKRCQADHVVSYCSGANVAVYGIAQEIIRTRSLCLISPSLDMGMVGKKTTYQQTFLPLLVRIAKEGARTAALVRAILQQTTPKPKSDIDIELSVINNLPFKDDKSTYRYAQLHAACLQLNWAELLRKIRVPTMVLHGEDDEIIHADTVKAIVAAISKARVTWLRDGGHFAIYKSQDLLAEVGSFLAVVIG